MSSLEASPFNARAPLVSTGRLSLILPRLLILWAGVGLGVAFVATPAKFLASSLSLPVALDVGRRTFQVYNWLDLVLLGICALLAAAGASRRAALALSGPAAVILFQAFWLLPALDVRTLAVISGDAAPGSNLHSIYIVAEGLKLGWLLLAGFAWRSSARTIGTPR